MKREKIKRLKCLEGFIYKVLCDGTIAQPKTIKDAQKIAQVNREMQKDLNKIVRE